MEVGGEQGTKAKIGNKAVRRLEVEKGFHRLVLGVRKGGLEPWVTRVSKTGTYRSKKHLVPSLLLGKGEACYEGEGWPVECTLTVRGTKE